MGIVNYGQFVVSAILLNLVPGSDTVYVLTRAIVGGRKKGVISALGISTGILVHTLLAAFGLSVILRESALAFNIMKIAGAGYLVFLGIKAVVSKKPLFDSDPESLDESPLKVYRQGVLTNVLNPKAALFPCPAASVCFAKRRVIAAAVSCFGVDLFHHKHDLERCSGLCRVLCKCAAS